MIFLSQFLDIIRISANSFFPRTPRLLHSLLVVYFNFRVNVFLMVFRVTVLIS